MYMYNTHAYTHIHIYKNFIYITSTKITESVVYSYGIQQTI